MRYIVNKDGVVLIKVEDGPIDVEDLEKRGEFVVESELTSPVDGLKFKHGKLSVRRKTQEELDAERRQRELDEREALIANRMHKIAEDQLIEEGIIREDL